MPADRPAEVAPDYAETLYAPVSWWLAALGSAVVVWWVFVLATPMAVAVGAAVLTALSAGAGVWSYGRASIGVRAGTVYAGGASIEPAYCAAATALDPQRTAAVRGPEADARAYLLLRPYIDTAVRLEVDDPRDPTPYWLISCRHPKRFAAAIEAALATGRMDPPGD